VRVEDGLFASQFRLRHLDEAHLWFIPRGQGGDEHVLDFEGAQARPPPEQRETAGIFEDLTLDSAAHGETRGSSSTGRRNSTAMSPSPCSP